jgi:hypothetical protein
MKRLAEFIHMADDPNFTQEQAAAAVDIEVEEMVRQLGYDEKEARRILLTNIGYFAGYYPNDLADRVYGLFQTQHPIFGLTHPTAEEAFKAGYLLGLKPRNEEIH